MYLALILYLIGVPVWFMYSKYSWNMSYEESIVMAVFYPIAFGLFTLIWTLLFFISPIGELIYQFKARKEDENDN